MHAKTLLLPLAALGMMLFITGCDGNTHKAQDGTTSAQEKVSKGEPDTKASKGKKARKKASKDKPSASANNPLKDANLKDSTPWPWGDDAKVPKRPKVCPAAHPTREHLGIKPKDFIGCLEAILKRSKLPAEAQPPFKKANAKGLEIYTIKDYVAVQITPHTSGNIERMDVFFFNTLREAHSFEPELRAQYGALAALLPTVGANPSRGEALFKSIDQRGRKANSPQITSHWDGITLESSFLPVSVRYRFTASSN